MKLILTLILLAVTLGCAVLFVLFIIGTLPISASPRNLGTIPIFIFGLTMLAALWIPWDKLGLRIKKIGVLEFEEIIAEKEEEHSEDISNLYKKIRLLEWKLHDLSNDLEELQDDDKVVKDMILDLLAKYPKSSFSSTRILSWGPKQEGFSDLGNLNITELRCLLSDLTKNGCLTTTISERGSIMYKYVKHK